MYGWGAVKKQEDQYILGPTDTEQLLQLELLHEVSYKKWLACETAAVCSISNDKAHRAGALEGMVQKTGGNDIREKKKDQGSLPLLE